jgi:hypothetical protein
VLDVGGWGVEVEVEMGLSTTWVAWSADVRRWGGMAGDDGGGHILKMAGVRENDRKRPFPNMGYFFLGKCFLIG